MGAGEQYDVAVVGYGPTGVTAANLLGGMGLRVVVIERDTDIYTRARAISTDEEVMRIWQSIGLADQLKRDVLAGLPLQFVDQNGAAIFEALPTCYGSGHPAQMFIYQPALEAELRIGVERYPNVEVLLGHECLKVCQGPDDPAGVELTVVETGGDRVTRLRATYVIASDGGSSGMRAQLNVGYQGQTYEDRWVVIDTKMLKPWPHHDKLRFHCDPKRPAVDCPTPLEHHRWEFPVLPGEDERYLVTDEAIWELLARYGIDSSHVKILRGVVYSHHVRLAARWRVGRVFLAGDAAHAMPPWIGQGMAAGVRDAANLCWKLAAVLKGELPDAVLDSYQDERLPHVREVTKRAVFVGRIITERRSAVATLRDPLVRAVTRVPGLSSHFQKSNWVPEPHYPTGFLARSGCTAIGRRLPQPPVLDATGERVPLDDALDRGWVVLRTTDGEVPPAWTDAGVAVVEVRGDGAPGEGAVLDTGGELRTWLRARGADVVAVRPDGFVYAAGRDGRPMSPPPAGLKVAP